MFLGIQIERKVYAYAYVMSLLQHFSIASVNGFRIVYLSIASDFYLPLSFIARISKLSQTLSLY